MPCLEKEGRNGRREKEGGKNEGEGREGRMRRKKLKYITKKSHDLTGF